MGEKESSENAELGGGVEPIMHEGSGNVPNELIEFGDSSGRENQFPEEGNGEKGCFSVVSFNGGK